MEIQPRKYIFIFLDIKYVIFIYLMDIRKTYNSFILKYSSTHQQQNIKSFFSIKQSLLCEIINVEFGFVIIILSCLSSWNYLNTIWMKFSQVFLMISFCILNQNVSIKKTWSYICWFDWCEEIFLLLLVILYHIMSQRLTNLR